MASLGFALVEVRLMDHKSRCFAAITMDSQEMLDFKPQAIDSILQAATAAAPNKTVARLAYCDEERDWCTLNKETLRDAMQFVMPVDGQAGVGCLEVQVFTENSQDEEQEEEKQVACEAAPSTPAAPIPTEADAIQALNMLARGTDLRRLVPRLATAALKFIEEAQQPALYGLIELLLDMQDGTLKADALPSVLPNILDVLTQVPPEDLLTLKERFKNEAVKVVEALKEEESGEQKQVVEVHPEIICDGCEACPIVGRRYKSLMHDDYDLCKNCFDRESRNPEHWTQIRSDTVGEVVYSYYATPAVVRDPDLPVVHHGVECDGCGQCPLRGRRFRCTNVPDYDLCEQCHGTYKATHSGEQRKLTFEEMVVVTSPAAAGVVPVGGKKVDEAVEEMVEEEPQEEAEEEQEKEAEPTSNESAREGPDDARACEDALVTLLQHSNEAVRAAAYEAVAESCSSFSQWRHLVPRLFLKGDLHKAQQDGSLKVQSEAAETTAPPVEESAAPAHEEEVEEPAKVPEVEETEAEEEPKQEEEREKEEKETQATSTEEEEAALSDEEGWLLEEGADVEDFDTISEGEPAGSVSATAVRSELLMQSVEAVDKALAEDGVAVGDVTAEFKAIVDESGARQAYRVGRVGLQAGGSDTSVPMCIKVVVMNDGQVPWPSSAQLAVVAGQDLGFPQLQLGAVQPGEAAEIVMDLLVPPKQEPGLLCSMWALMDSQCGSLIGPLLIFEAAYL